MAQISAVNAVGFKGNQTSFRAQENIMPRQAKEESMSGTTKLAIALTAAAAIGIATVAIMKGRGVKVPPVTTKPTELTKPVQKTAKEILQNRMAKVRKLTKKLEKRAVNIDDLVKNKKSGIIRTKDGKLYTGVIVDEIKGMERSDGTIVDAMLYSRVIKGKAQKTVFSVLCDTKTKKIVQYGLGSDKGGSYIGTSKFLIKGQELKGKKVKIKKIITTVKGCNVKEGIYSNKQFAKIEDEFKKFGFCLK